MNYVRGLSLLLIFLNIIACQETLTKPQVSPSISQEEIAPKFHTESLIIIIINVGQGDSTLILTPDSKSILIDGGNVNEGYETIIPLLSFLNITKINYLFLSHYDLDHYGGIIELFKGKDQINGTSDDFLPDIIFDRGMVEHPDNEYFEEYLKLSQPIRKEMFPSEEISLNNDLTIKCLSVNGNTEIYQTQSKLNLTENSRSISLKITYKDFNFFTGGDLTGGGMSGNQLTPDIESKLIDIIDKDSIDILKINHHGSNTSSNLDFLKHTNPTVSIISVGNDNPYDHPHSEVLSRLLEINTEIFQTEQGLNFFFDEAHIFNDSIYVEVNQAGSYLVNGIEFQTKSKLK